MIFPKLAVQIKPMHIYSISMVLVIFNVAVNVYLVTAEIQNIFNAAFGFVIAVIVTVFLVDLYFFSKKNNKIFTRTLLFISLSMVAWAIGDGIWLYLLKKNVDPFISASDVFYIAASILLIISLLTIPGSKQPSLRKKMVFIEISIFILSATVIFAVLLLVPGNPNLNFDPLVLLMVFIYPVLDIVLIWIIMVLFFTYPVKNIQQILGILFVGAGCIFFSDFLYLVNSLYKPLLPDYIVDIGYYFFYSSLLFAGIYGFKVISQKKH